MSAGRRSGVNWMRANEQCELRARALMVEVFARPGRPSSRTWPRATRQMSRRSMSDCCPTICFCTSLRTAPRCSAASATCFFTASLMFDIDYGKSRAASLTDARPRYSARGNPSGPRLEIFGRNIAASLYLGNLSRQTRREMVTRWDQYPTPRRVASFPALQEATDELAELVTEINLNVKIQGSPSGAAEAKSDALKELGDLACEVAGGIFAQADRILNHQVEKLIWQFRATAPDLYDKYQSARSIVGVASSSAEASPAAPTNVVPAPSAVTNETPANKAA